MKIFKMDNTFGKLSFEKDSYSLKETTQNSSNISSVSKRNNISTSKNFKNIIKNPLSPAQEEQERIFQDEILKKLIKEIKKELGFINTMLKVEIDNDLKIPVFKIINKETNEVIRQIPLEEILKLRKAIQKILEKEGLKESALKGIFIKKEV